MTIEEKNSQIGHAYRELQAAEAELAHRKDKLATFHRQVQAVATDWARLYAMNQTQLVIPGSQDPEFRPLPTEAEIAEIREIATLFRNTTGTAGQARRAEWVTPVKNNAEETRPTGDESDREHDPRDWGRDRRRYLQGRDDQAVFGAGPATRGPAVRRFQGISFPSRPRASIVICVIVSSFRTFFRPANSVT